MAWIVKCGDKSVALDDLSPQVFQQVAAKYKLSWLELYYGPAANLDAYYELLQACFARAEVEPPPKPETMGAARDLLDLLDQTEDDDRPKAGTTEESRAPEPDVPATT